MNALKEIETKLAHKKIKWAKIDIYVDGKKKDIRLYPDHSDQELDNFLKELSLIDYDHGYGIQHLYGLIMFNDGSWLDRRENDGYEWWVIVSVPDHEDYLD